ncbi:MAG: hypothetical protein ABI604_13835 [Nitrospirota bacterium]
MEKTKRILPALMIVLAILGLLTTPVLAKDEKKTGSKKPKNQASAVAASAASDAHVSHLDQGQKIGHLAHKTGPAWKILGGTLKNVHGDGTSIRLKTTKVIRSHYTPGKAQSTSTRKRSGIPSELKLREAASRIPLSSPSFTSAHPPHPR